MNKKENKHTNDDLKTMQQWSLDRKIQVTQTRILEWYSKFNGDVYISFSGGKDSAVLLDIARRMYSDIQAVFIDTGLEFPELREFVKTFDNVEWVKPEMNFKQVIEKYGYPLISKNVAQCIYEYRKKPDGCRGKYFDENSEYVKKYGKQYCLSRWKNLRDSDVPISHMCCNEMKKKPVKKYEKKSGLYPIVATMASESRSRKTSWLQTGCNSFNSKRPISQPMSFWTEQDVLTYIKRFNIAIPSVYGDIIEIKGKYKTTMQERTGCMFCAFGVHLQKEPNNFQRMKTTHPKIWEYCMKSVSDGGLGMKEVLEYINVEIE